MKNLMILSLVLTFILPGISADSVSNSYGDPGDAYLEYSISGPDFSGDPDGPPVHIGAYTGEPIHFSGKMIVSRPEGLRSYVNMKASLADQSVIWPEEGEDNTVENKVVELPFDFTFQVPEDYSAETVLGNVRLEACAGGCGVYNIDLRVSVEKKEPEVEDMPPVVKDEPHIEKAPIIEEPCVDSGAKFSDISKEVEIFPESNPENIRSAKLHSVLCVNDHIITGEESYAWITFPDLSSIIMKEEAEIIILALPKQEEKTVLGQLKGRILMNIKKVIAGESIEVKSNLATIGIKGTTFVSEVSDQGHILKVMEGAVEMTSAINGQKEMVNAGEKASATPSGLSEISAFDVEEESHDWPEIEKKGNSGSMLVPIIIVLALVAAGGFLLMKKK